MDSTSDFILAHAQLVKPRKRQRYVSAYTEAFSDCLAPDDTWCVDFQGEFVPSNKKWCYPLTVTDNFSRYLSFVRDDQIPKQCLWLLALSSFLKNTVCLTQYVRTMAHLFRQPHSVTLADFICLQNEFIRTK